VPSVWIEKRRTASGGVRYRVEYRLGGRGTRSHYAGSFATRREADARRKWVGGELAALRVPDLTLVAPEQVSSPTLAEYAQRWQASRVDVAGGTGSTYIVNLNRIVPLLGTKPVDTITTEDVAALVAELHAKGLKRESIRKTRSTLAMVLDFAGVEPNPARDTKKVKLPREEPEEPNPPTAEQVEAVLRLLPSKYVLPVLWLDWSGARVTAGVEGLTVGDFDEARGRIRMRAATTKTRKALWNELHPVLAEAIARTLPPRDDRDLSAPLFPGVNANALRTAIAKACRATGTALWSPHDLKHRRISLLHARGWSWARVGAYTGNTSLKLTSDTYTHVLMDESELDYAALLADRPM
jgi:integrase